MKKLFSGSIAALALACSSSCVARGTSVLTPKGKRQIEDLVVGDEVFCVDPQTGELIAARLSATRSAKRECVELSFAGGSLIVTSDHPLYCPEKREWAPAGDWALGRRTRLLRVSDHRTQVVEVHAVSKFAGVHEVFDLTVDHDLHNFVANDVLVHNKREIPESCAAADAGQVKDGNLCTCPDGTQSVVECVSTDAGREAICLECKAVVPDAGVTDGGADSDGGVDGGP